MVNFSKLRKDFPILKQKVHGKPLSYLDNAATTQKPRHVINAVKEYYENYNANIHRGIHHLSEVATEKYENTRKGVADFINAKSPKEIVFTKNTTESLNLIAYSLETGMKKGDNVVSTVMEHHSNIVPWQMLKNKGVSLRFADIDNTGHLNIKDFKNLINEKTKIVTVTHASNVLGTINNVKKIAKIAHESGAILVVDGAQSAPHMPVDVQKLDADFLAFSAHKMLGPTGVGILYGKERILEEMQPFLRGGDMIKEVTTDRATFNDVPHKFEAGTPNIADIIAFSTSINYLNNIGMDNIRKHEVKLTKYALNALRKIDGVTIYGPEKAEEKTGVISFNINGIHSHDVSELLNEDGIAIRSGHSCAMPLMKRLGCESVARASFYVYNTRGEIDNLKSVLEKAKKVFGV